MLEAIARAGVDFCVFGTYALHLHDVLPDGYVLKDCDIALEKSLVNLTRFVRSLSDAGWQVTVWDEPVSLPLDMGFLEGKYYLRCTRGAQLLDATYELDPIPWLVWEETRHWIGSIPVGGLEEVLQLKAYRGRERDLEVVNAVRSILSTMHR